MLRIVERQREWIREHAGRLVEGNSVPFEIVLGFLRVPFVNHVLILRLETDPSSIFGALWILAG